jgi:hypothetical protein
MYWVGGGDDCVSIDRQGNKQTNRKNNKNCAITMQDYAPSPAVLLQLTPSDWKNTEDKRNNWNRMQGMWGKRSQQQSDGSALSEMTPPRVSSAAHNRTNSFCSARGKNKPALSLLITIHYILSFRIQLFFAQHIRGFAQTFTCAISSRFLPPLLLYFLKSILTNGLCITYK